MWLFVVAQVGREVNGYESGVGFILEYPEGMPRSERDRRALQVEQMERVLQEGFLLKIMVFPTAKKSTLSQRMP